MTQLSSALTSRVPGACVQCTRSPWHWGGCSPLPPVIPLPRPTSRPAPTLPGSLVLTPLCCLVSCTDGIDRLFSTSPREERGTELSSSRPLCNRRGIERAGRVPNWLSGKSPGLFYGLPGGSPAGGGGGQKEGPQVPTPLGSVLHFRMLCETLFRQRVWLPKLKN